MNIVGTGSTYKIYNDDLQTFTKLPVGVYKADCGQFTGFFLEKHPDIQLTEKLYGPHKEKVNKILDAFPKFERNLGVIFSGDKGIGKSVAAKLMTKLAIERGLPVILVNEYLPGISDFLNQIEQEVVVIFDEFDKTFYGGRDNDGNDRQTELLTLLDGFGVGKKLYVVTCNSLYHLNDFLVNRPGRFHYHITFKYPVAEEIREYLKDKLDKRYHKEIESVVAFASNVDINYDCLRAIAFELNNGLTFAEAIGDLNIINNGDNNDKYNVFVTLATGERLTLKKYYMDSMDSDEADIYLDDGKYRISFNFIPADDITYSIDKGCSVVSPDSITNLRMWKYKTIDEKDDDGNVIDTRHIRVELKEDEFVPIKEIAFKRIIDRKDIHYLS